MDLRVAAVVGGVVLVAGCSAPSAAPTPAAAPSSPTSGAALPTDYEYLLSSSCGHRALIGDYRVTVLAGEVTQVVGLDPDYPYRPGPSDVPSLADLLELARSAQEEPDAVVVLETGPDGVPVSLSIDHVPNGVDDEECYTVSELVVIEP